MRPYFVVVLALTASSLVACTAFSEDETTDPEPTKEVSEIRTLEGTLDRDRESVTNARTGRTLTPGEREANERLEHTVQNERFQESK